MKKCLLLLTIFFWGLNAICQQVALQISVNVTPPFISKAEGLLGGSPGGNVMVTITNTARATQMFKLVPTLTGQSKNFSITFRPNFMPAAPSRVTQVGYPTQVP